MTKYIDTEKLIAEIERYKQGAAIARFDNAGENADYFQGKVDLCDDLTHIITSLQQEQPDVDLEKAIEDYYGNIPDDEDKVKAARHFYELGYRHTAVLYDDIEKERQRRCENEPTIKGWVARDECLCFFQGKKPTLNEETNLWYNTEYDPIYLDESLFPDIQLENSPVEFELTIHRV